MKRLFVTLIALIALTFAVQAAPPSGWFIVWSGGGETYMINPDITQTDNGKSYLVWICNTFDEPETRESYTRENEFNKTVAYKITLYKFSDNGKKLNIVQSSNYGEDDSVIFQYSNPDLENTAIDIPDESLFKIIAENVMILYEIKTNPE